MLNLPFLIAEWNRIREGLLATFPELDEETLVDSVDGEAGALDAVASLIRSAREDEAFASALGTMMDEMEIRQTRLEKRAHQRREGALALMKAIGVRKIERPDFLASIRSNPPRVEIEDEAAVPEAFCVISRKADKRAIKEALSNGLDAGWARLCAGSETLAARFK